MRRLLGIVVAMSLWAPVALADDTSGTSSTLDKLGMTFAAGGSHGSPAFSTKSQMANHECVASAIAGVQLSPRAVPCMGAKNINANV